MINENHINELKRIAVNTYETDKRAELYEIIRGINELKDNNLQLINENKKLKELISTRPENKCGSQGCKKKID